MGIRREWLESAGSFKVNPHQKRPAACVLCKFVVAPRGVNPALELVSQSCVRLFGGTDETTCACERSMKAVPSAEKRAGRSHEGSTQETNLQREGSVLRFQSHLPGFESVDSHDWPKIPTIDLKNRRTFTLFTNGYRSWQPADAKPLSPVGNAITTFTQGRLMDAANWNENIGERRSRKYASGVRRRAGGEGLQP